MSASTKPWRAPASAVFLAIFAAAPAPAQEPLGAVRFDVRIAMDRARCATTQEAFIREMDALFAAQDAEEARRLKAGPVVELEPLTEESLAETMRLRERELRCREIARDAVERARVRKAGA